LQGKSKLGAFSGLEKRSKATDGVVAHPRPVDGERSGSSMEKWIATKNDFRRWDIGLVQPSVRSGHNVGHSNSLSVFTARLKKVNIERIELSRGYVEEEREERLHELKKSKLRYCRRESSSKFRRPVFPVLFQ
jgi:hypothetical protein